MNKRLITGIRASGEIHLGNLLGSMLPAIERQEEFDSYLFIADYHGLTTTPPAVELKANTRMVAAAWLAAGINPETTTFWKQSDVPEHVELSYILACVTSMGLMERAHSYKDLKAKNKNIKMGLFYYPLLMAADILLYKAELVPVGKDQIQHLEMTRDMATFFNEAYGETFPLPEAIVMENQAAIPGTDGRKMSKSYSNGIHIFSPEKIMKKEVMKIVTDSKELGEPKDPDTCIVYNIFRVVAAAEQSAEMADKLKAGGYGYGSAKKDLLTLLTEKYDAMRQSYQDWISRPQDLDDILQFGAAKAKLKAKEMMEEVRQKVGL